MAEKYIDLHDEVADSIHWDATVADTLKWLDDHPDQVPGRTIAESTACDLRKIAQHSDYAGFAGALSMRGITVVPDPKPTNAERLKAMQDDWLRESRSGELFIEYLDRMGAKAPGGDDD